MAFSKISGAGSTPEALNTLGAMTLPNQPTISAEALKKVFDDPAKVGVAPAVNRLVDELEAGSASASIGATAPTGRSGNTVQAVMNDISADLATVEGEIETAIADAHTHSNKAVIDKFSEVEGEPYYDGSPIVGAFTYDDLTNKPKINSVELSGNKSLSDLGIPTTLAALGDDTTHRTVTDTEKTTWNGKSTVTVTPVVTTGTKIATITVDGTDSDLYASSGGGGGSVNDAYKSVKVGTTTISASGEDTIEFVAGSNVTLTPDASTKKVTIAASGGGQSTGDMLMADYDSTATVKSAGGIVAYVASQAYTLPTAGSSTLGGVKINGNNLSIDGNGVLSATDTTYTSKSESQGGTAESLVTTGEKYTWNHKQDALTIDASPTSSSTNPVQSGGVYTSLGTKIDNPSTKSDGQVLTYDGTNSEWKAVTPTTGATTWSELSSKPFSTVGDGLTVTSDTLKANVQLVSVGGAGTASETAVHLQKVTVNTTEYTIDGTVYMQDNSKSTSSGVDTFSFTNSTYITADSVIDVYADVYGVAPTAVTVNGSTHNVTVKFSSSDGVSKCRIYIR